MLLCILVTGKHPAAQRSLCGDLDAILAKALKKDPDKRYPSVDALADDLRLYLRNKRTGVRGKRLATTLFALAIAVTAIGVFALVALKRPKLAV